MVIHGMVDPSLPYPNPLHKEKGEQHSCTSTEFHNTYTYF